MKRTNLRLQWRTDPLRRSFRAGVSLHSHTHHSRESLGFICRIAARVGFIDAALKRGRQLHGAGFDLARGWWTPPLVPRAAWDLEREHIESGLGLLALVSLTDHDSIEAPLSLGVLESCREMPISVEWSVPFAGALLHLGIHNLPPRIARQAMDAMAAYTARPDENSIGDLLRWFDSQPQTLVVFNHPLWDESEVGPDVHRRAADRLLRRYGGAIHALELNGLRPWTENAQIVELATAWEKPVVSGGDRHGLEPNAMLNLTAAASFSEFVEEVRRDGRSQVLIASHYRRPFFWRIVDSVLDAVGDHERHGLGWKTWNQRVFYLCEDGRVRSLKEIWGDRVPGLVRHFTFLARSLHGSWLQKTLHAALATRSEVAW